MIFRVRNLMLTLVSIATISLAVLPSARADTPEPDVEPMSVVTCGQSHHMMRAVPYGSGPNWLEFGAYVFCSFPRDLSADIVIERKFPSTNTFRPVARATRYSVASAMTVSDTEQCTKKDKYFEYKMTVYATLNGVQQTPYVLREALMCKLPSLY